MYIEDLHDASPCLTNQYTKKCTIKKEGTYAKGKNGHFTTGFCHIIRSKRLCKTGN